MPRKPGDVQVQVVMPPAMRKALGKAALNIQDDVPRSKLMERGPMLRYVARWFLSLGEEDQLKIVLAGQEMSERDATEGAMEIVKAIGLDDIIGKLVERPATGSFWGGEPLAEEGGEGPGEDVQKGLKGKKGAVGVRRNAPKGK